MSLRVKAMAGAIVVLVSMATVLGFEAPQITETAMQQAYGKQIDFILDLLVDGCSTTLASEQPDRDELSRFLRSAVQGSGVVYCAAFDESGEELLAYAAASGYTSAPNRDVFHFQVQQDPRAFGAPETADDLIPLFRDVTNRGHSDGPTGRVGYIWLAHTGKPVAQVQALVTKRIWLLIAGVTAMAALLSWLTARSIIKPIYDLIRGTRQIASGDLQARVEVSSHDEIQLLAESFNSMSVKLSESKERLDAHRRMLEKTVRQRTRKLRKANEELRVLDTLKDGFLSSISHEFRTPLTSIRAFSEILLEMNNTDEETRQEFLGIILKESERLTGLVDDILDLVKIESGEMPFHFKPTTPRHAVDHALEAIEERLKDRSIDISVKVGRDLPEVIWDSSKVSRILHKLLANAIRFSPFCGKIEVGASYHDGGIRLCLRDHGPGIPEEHLETVFTKFRQMGETLTGKPTGTGIGLPICRQIAMHHGGTIHAESPAEGHGVQFILQLPLQPPDKILRAQEPITPREHESAQSEQFVT